MEERLIAEGGYGYVYEVSDGRGNRFALKKMNILSPQQLNNIKREIAVWQKINKGPNVVRILDFEIGRESVNILMELCTEGSLLDYINNYKGNISEREALSIIKQIANGLFGMHSQNPPISHRDIKIENVLKFGNSYKLCDFGSASSEVMNPRNETKQSLLEKFEVYERTTTFIYRPPEMCDEYCNYIVNEKVDVWAVGCILYTILFKIHPFQDAQKLTITTAHYYIPKEAKNYSEKIIDFIRLMLTPNPSNRPSIREVLGYIQCWDSIRDIKLSNEVIEIKKKQIQNLNERLNNSSAKEVSMEELMKAKEAILKDMKKKTKYIRKNDDDDINDLFDDGDEYYKSHPEKRNQISKPQYNINNPPSQSNNNTQLLFDFNSNFANNNSKNFTQSNNSQQKSGDLLGFDFDTPSTVNTANVGFNFDQHLNANNGFNFDQHFGTNQQTNTVYQPMSNNTNNYQPFQPQGKNQQNILNFFQ